MGAAESAASSKAWSPPGVPLKTRDRILDTSLRLFNDGGLAVVSTNRIATEVAISPGNLYYHFKNKERIVDSLVRRFELRAEPITASLPTVSSVDDLWLSLHLMIELIHAFRFVFRDADFLIREYPGARVRVRRFTGSTLEASRLMCANLAACNVLQVAPEGRDAIAFQIVFTASCGFMFSKLLPNEDLAAADPGRAAYQILTLLTPYLDADSRHYILYLRSKYRT